MSLLTRDLLILMDSAIIRIYFRNSQPLISLTAAASLFGDTLAIKLTNLLKQDLQWNRTVQMTVAVVVKSWPELVNKKLETRTSKYKFGDGASKHKLGATAGKSKLGSRAGKYKLGARVGGRNWGTGTGPGLGTRQRAGDQKYKFPNLTIVFITMFQKVLKELHIWVRRFEPKEK